MWRLTLAQMRRSLGRLTAAGIAIVIGTSFVAATLIASAVITRTSYDAVAASYADADLVITPADGAELTGAQIAALRDTRGVVALDGRRILSIELAAGPKRVVPEVTARASSPRLEAQKLVGGSFPSRAGEIAVPGPLAHRLGVHLGDVVTANRQVPEPLTVVGLLDDPAGAFAQSGGAVVASSQDVARWAADDAAGSPASFASAVVALADGADVAGLRSALAAATDADLSILTKDEQAAAITVELTHGTNVFTQIVLGFAAVALLVAALVIANTFQVLIAQRTRTLALLRCVGADKKQLRRSVLLEAGLLGISGSVLGLLLGVGVAQIALQVLRGRNLDVPLPGAVSITPAVILAPLAVGILITVLAALAPARAATRVAPLAALRPADAPALTQRRNLPRVVLAGLLTAGGTVLLAGAVVIGPSVDASVSLAVGVLGGATSFVGVLVGSVFWVPRVVGAAGRLLGQTGVAARLAATNTARNPRRTAATSTALLIGVTLVAMMSTGAASARATLDRALDDQYPVDVAIGRDGPTIAADGTSAELITPELVRTVEKVPGVAVVAALRTFRVALTPGTAPGAGALGGGETVGATAISPSEAASVLRSTSMYATLGDSTVIVAADTAADLGVATGDRVTLAATELAADGTETPQGSPLELTAVVTALPSGVLVTPGALTRMAVDLPVNQVWARLIDVRDAGTVVPTIEDALSATAVQISGAGVARAQYERIIDTLLAVVVGLLAVAVLIALIGVANTLSLSVLERRRESATLRALGLSRGQLRATLAIEGMLIAGVGAALGAVLGTLYGWAGAATVLGVIGVVQLDVPWLDLGLVLLVALVAGLLASVIPGRIAARTSPVAALAVD